MRIFIGYGYNNLDEWIRTLVFSLIKAVGHDDSSKVCLKTGSPIQLEHELQLLYDDGTPTSA